MLSLQRPSCFRLLFSLNVLISYAFGAAALAQEGANPAKKTPYRPHSICVMNADGTGWKQFFALPQMGAHGSPSISPDGKWLVYDGWGSLQGEGTSHSNVMAISLDRDQLRFLGPGLMPNFGDDSTQVLASIPSGPAARIGVIDLNTGESKRISSDGWGAKWSPDGKTISYYDRREIVLVDVETETSRVLFSPEDGSSVLWNSSWSPDSKRIFVTLQEYTGDRMRKIVSVNVDDQPAQATEHFRGKGLGERVTLHQPNPA